MRALIALAAASTMSSLACTGDDTAGEAPAAAASAPITNRVLIPPAVRQSLGITFVKAEERRVASTLRLAGHVDATREGRTPYHASVPGTVEIAVSPFDTVEAGTLLASVASPLLLEHRHQLHVAADGVDAARDAVRVQAALHRQATETLAHLRKRIEGLRRAGASKAELDATRVELESRADVLKAQLAARRNELQRARHRFEAELASFATRVDLSVEDLRQQTPSGLPRWEEIHRLELRARKPGTVSKLAVDSGAWIEPGGLVLEVVDPKAVWVECRALTSDIGRLATGQRAEITPVERPGGATPEPVSGTLRMGVAGDERRHTFPCFVAPDATPDWLRPGLGVFVDVAVKATGGPEIAIPAASLIRDGLETIFFRRDPADPDKVIRTTADVGPSDGRWTVVYSGVMPGDEVVVDGAYELKLASTKKPNVVGHFHADGTFHEGTD